MEMRMNGLGGIAAAVVGLAVVGGALLYERPPAPAAAAAATPLAAIDPAKLGQSAASAVKPKPADERFVIKRILPITGPIKYGQWHWDEKDVPAGPLVVTVDLEARVLSVFRGGYEIGATAVLLGTDEKPTPLGSFPITEKDADHISNLYDAPMPHMLRLTNDGISIHGTTVELGYASHGCVGVPDDFAAKLYGVASLGDRVIITKGKQAAMGDSLVEG